MQEASSPNVMPAGVMPAYSRLTTMKPLDIGSMPEMHSKQPQEVIGSSMMEYSVTSSTAPVRRVLDGLVDRGVAAGALVEAAFLQDGLGRAVRVQLVGRLRVEPRNGAAEAEPFRCDDAAVRRGERLTEDAGEEAVDRFVGHGGQTVVTCVVARHGDFVQERGLPGSVMRRTSHLSTTASNSSMIMWYRTSPK